MAIPITCSCKAQLEIDEKFAGQTITCPDCNQSLEIPAPEKLTIRTSGLALTSLMLALVGACTVVGTVAAVVVGVFGVLQIRKHPDKISGKEYAYAGIALGGFFTLISLFAYSPFELFGVDNLLQQSQWIGRLSYPEKLEVELPREGFKIKRPNKQWGVLRDTVSDDSGSVKPEHTLLVEPTKGLYVYCLVAKVGAAETQGWEQAREYAHKVFKGIHLDRGKIREGLRDVDLTEGEGDRRLPDVNKGYTSGHEMYVEKTYKGRTKKFVVRLIRNEKNEEKGLESKILYILAAGCDKNSFEANETELREVLDSFEVTGETGKTVNNWE